MSVVIKCRGLSGVSGDKLSKAEAAEFLGVSPRSVERYSQRGKLHPIYFEGDNGKEAYYRLEELEKLKADTSTPLHVSEVVGGDENDENDKGITYAQTPDSLIIIHEIVNKLLEVVQSTQFKQELKPLVAYEELEKAAEKQWILPTSVVKELIKVKPHGSVYTRGAFRFVKTGKIGAEAGWKVEKVQA
ncbi:helix-turn-helix domain-containing protein [Tolypothrix campylonemoides VB511288]|nr:helix-turn-helix domain-containing protein [Tolypothrix campylonemoides VB511288]